MTSYHVPPRPEGGYPDEFFDSWDRTSPLVFATWLTAYEAVNPGDPNGDLARWLYRHATDGVVVNDSEGQATMRVIGVRLPPAMIARLEAEGAERADRAGRSGVIRDALAEHWKLGEAS